MRSGGQLNHLKIGVVLAMAPLWSIPSRADDVQDLTAAMVQGIQLVKAGRYAEAEEANGRVSLSAERVAASSPMDAQAALLMLALANLPQGRLVQAARLSEQAMAIAERSFPPDHEAVLVCLKALATIYVRQGRYTRAEPIVRRMVAAAERTRDTNPLVYVSASTALAELYQFQGRSDEAEPLYRQALDFQKATLGTNQPTYLSCLRNLAIVYCARGKNAEAEPLAREALQLSRSPLGPNLFNQMMVSANLTLLADIVVGLGRAGEGVDLYTEAVAINEKFYSPDSPLLIRAKMKLLGLLFGAGRVDRAMRLVDQVLGVLDREKIDPGNRSVCYLLKSKSAWQAGDRAGALADLGRAMDLAEEVRASVTGSEFDRARAFSQFGNVFRARWFESQFSLGDIAVRPSRPPNGAGPGRSRTSLELTGVDVTQGRSRPVTDRVAG